MERTTQSAHEDTETLFKDILQTVGNSAPSLGFQVQLQSMLLLDEILKQLEILNHSAPVDRSKR